MASKPSCTGSDPGGGELQAAHAKARVEKSERDRGEEAMEVGRADFLAEKVRSGEGW